MSRCLLIALFYLLCLRPGLLLFGFTQSAIIVRMDVISASTASTAINHFEISLDMNSIALFTRSIMKHMITRIASIAVKCESRTLIARILFEKSKI